MLKETIPQDVQQLVLNARMLSSDEALTYLPPKHVQEALMAELGIFVSPNKNLPTQAADWIKDQRDYQERAIAAYARLQEKEPFTPEVSQSASIPLWAVSKWAQILQLDWSAKLASAVVEAEEYLSGIDER